MTSNKDVLQQVSFSISARTALLLGRESISNSVTAVRELVKNAYDADARNVTVRFRKATTSEGTIEIIDDGHGMDLDDIQTKWLLIGVSHKQREPLSPKKRVRVGEKGVGRLALDRLAAIVIMKTTPEYAPQEGTHQLSIDWNKFLATDKAIEDVELPFETIPRRQSPGTILKLHDLRETWTKREFKKLYDDLSVLLPPFQTKHSNFTIHFDCDEMPELQGPIQSPIVGAALFSMQARMDENYEVRIDVTTREDSPNGESRPFTSHIRSWYGLFDTSEAPQCGPLELELFFYLREGKSYQGLSVTLGRVREFLNLHGGVRIYRDDFRVSPYGDPNTTQGDWLGLGSRRTRRNYGVGSTKGPWAVAENQIAAAVFITRQQNPLIRDTTSREGLIENPAYQDMRKFVEKCIEFFESDRQAYERKKVKDAPPTVESTVEESKQQTNQLIDTILDAVQDSEISNVLSQSRLKTLKNDLVQKIDVIQDVYVQELQETVATQRIYQNLATIGIVVSSMGHNILPSARQIPNTIDRLMKRLSALTLFSDEKAKRYAERLRKYGQTIYALSYFALNHIRRDKRERTKEVNINAIIKELYEETLLELCGTVKAQIAFLPEANLPLIIAFPSEIESIVINFVTNSLAAFQRKPMTPIDNRMIEIETHYDPLAKAVQIIARDSGLGIPDDDLGRIFDVLYTTKISADGTSSDGTGLGLSIVKDIVESYSIGDNLAHVQVIGHGAKLSGAEFVVTLPVPKSYLPEENDNV
ncbi:hypothetical protein MNBD_CHLOROFLEXI01-5009 [hydrothermal vent metagenome]|uniref:Histidine kinase domain-containing protein n=1 Tax=hydrothermal vent metagenome TaxID=652676 RepID=A0A3B0V281_9ZZZZ